MKIPFIDIKQQNVLLKDELMKAVGKVLDSNEFILGEEVALFEKEFAGLCGCNYAVGLNSGTDALFLALLSLNVGPGDEVICPVYTYIATALSISYTGAKPVFVDIDERTFNIDAQKIEEKITKKTKAIIAVHLYGQSADMAPILKIARKHGLKVVEDAAQAHGVKWFNPGKNWQNVGSIADVGCFSFYPTKNLSGCGDGGIAVTNNKKIYERIFMLRDQGRKKGKNRYLHYSKGYNSRLDSIQAALLRVKLKFMNEWNELRREKAHLYSQYLSDIPGINVPYESSFSRHVFHIYAILCKGRDMISGKLREKGIYTGIVYHTPLHLQAAYKELKHKKGDFPVAEKISRQVLCLPIYPHLSDKDIAYITKNLIGLQTAA